MIPNLAIFSGEHLKAKIDADPEFRNSFAVSAALRFASLAYLSGIERGLSMHRHGISEEIFKDLQTTSGRQGIYQRAFEEAHLIECHLNLCQVDYIRAEVIAIGHKGTPLFTWVAVFQPDGSGDIISSHESQASKDLRREMKTS